MKTICERFSLLRRTNQARATKICQIPCTEKVVKSSLEANMTSSHGAARDPYRRQQEDTGVVQIRLTWERIDDQADFAGAHGFQLEASAPGRGRRSCSRHYRRRSIVLENFTARGFKCFCPNIRPAKTSRRACEDGGGGWWSSWETAHLHNNTVRTETRDA